VIDVALLSVIRRCRQRDKISIRQIAKRTGLSRNTVRRYLASGAVEPKYSMKKLLTTITLLCFPPALIITVANPILKS